MYICTSLTFDYVIFLHAFFLSSHCRVSRESVRWLRHISPLHVRLPIYSYKVVFSVNLRVGLRVSRRLRDTHPRKEVVNHLRTNLLGLHAITTLHLASPFLRELGEEVPQGLSGPRKFSHTTQARCATICPLHSTSPPLTSPTQSRRRTGENGESGHHLQSYRVRWWCQKKSGNIRICVDLKPLNLSVLREVHPLPKVDATLTQLSGAKFFSKLEANGGFWPLSQSLRYLTTFITPIWHLNSTRTLSAQDERAPHWPPESPLPHGRRPRLWPSNTAKKFGQTRETSTPLYVSTGTSRES